MPDDGPGPPLTLARVLGLPTPTGAVDLEVRAGEAVRVVGPNGSGKTSLLRALAGLDGPVRPAAVEVDGDDPRDLPASLRRDRSDLLWQHAGDGLVGLTVDGEFRVRGRSLTRVGSLRHRDVATLSTGEARRVTLALAEAGGVPLLLLDEPAEGLDAEGRDWLRRLVREARSRGAAVFVDPDGTLTGEATRTVSLGAVERVAPRRFESGSIRPERSRIRHEPTTVTLGDRTLHLPALDVGAGLHVLAGPNGGGKTTLLRRLAGLGPHPSAKPGTPYLPPRARDLLTDDSVAACLRGAAPDAVEALVPRRLLGRHPWTLSGGEAQRVALASVLGHPGPVLLDEPDAHLDGQGYGALCDALRARVEAGGVVVAATHDPGLLAAATTVVGVGP